MQRVYVNTKKAIAGLAHKKEREFEKETNIHASVAYLETRQTSTTDHFYENCQCLMFKLFSHKSSLSEVRLDSKKCLYIIERS